MPRILIVDDDDYYRETLRKFLEMNHFDIVEAADAGEALESLDRSIDLVLTDLIMPEVSGVDLIHKIRKRSDVKIIAVSGYGVFSSEPMEDSVPLSIEASFIKGGNIQELLEMIQELLSLKNE